MRALVVTLTALLGICAAVCGDVSGPDLREAKALPLLRLYYGPSRGHSVTIKSDNGVVTVLEIPAGVLLGIETSVEGNPSLREALEPPITLMGDVTIRARRDDELDPSESTSAEEIMASAPVVMELTGVVVDLDEMER